jgi:acyl-coenzyme A synthetase/AMP-(fatty) acid ligase
MTFDYHDGDVFWCTADVGWVTGHSYIVYGPLANGATTVATGGFTLKRLAYKIGEKEWADTSMVADDVQVKFKLALTGVTKI